MNITDPCSPQAARIFLCRKKPSSPQEDDGPVPSAGFCRYLHYLWLSSAYFNKSRNTPTSSGAMIALSNEFMNYHH
ncbi:hypothetical protein, partial [Liquorilactobacillus satsumensis]|uniref:hypothetical protein n=1 Tax=Liquorilactobacillus satsumensis TaxID=259059 RepID=UPI0039EAF4CC